MVQQLHYPPLPTASPTPKPDATPRPTSLPQGRRLEFGEGIITLDEFEPHQTLRILVYERAYPLAIFVTEWVITTDALGFFELEVADGKVSDYEYTVVDAETGNRLFSTAWFEERPISPGGN